MPSKGISDANPKAFTYIRSPISTNTYWVPIKLSTNKSFSSSLRQRGMKKKIEYRDLIEILCMHNLDLGHKKHNY
jgi:hypothetical protein